MASGQPEVLTTWSTFYASTYWNMRFSVAGAAMDAHVQNDIMLRDRTRSPDSQVQVQNEIFLSDRLEEWLGNANHINSHINDK